MSIKEGICFVRRHWGKFATALLTAIIIVVVTILATNRLQEKEDQAVIVRQAILECTTPGTQSDPHQCFDKIQSDSQIRSAKTIQRAVELLAVDNDCRIRRTLAGMPAPENKDSEGRLIPCPEQTPVEVYPGRQGRQ